MYQCLNNSRIISNYVSGLSEREFNNRSYLVAPLTLIVPGILNGSEGPSFYPASEMSKSFGRWDGRPLTLGHPMRNGKPSSAMAPGMLEKIGLGFVRNVRFTGKLVGDGWFDVLKTFRIARDLLDKLYYGHPIEVSTGLFCDYKNESGYHFGRPYNRVAVEHRPDHVAVLTNEVGACSVDDGCGVYARNEAQTCNCNSPGRCTCDREPLGLPIIDWSKSE